MQEHENNTEDTGAAEVPGVAPVDEGNTDNAEAQPENDTVGTEVSDGDSDTGSEGEDSQDTPDDSQPDSTVVEDGTVPEEPVTVTDTDEPQEEHFGHYVITGQTPVNDEAGNTIAPLAIGYTYLLPVSLGNDYCERGLARIADETEIEKYEKDNAPVPVKKYHDGVEETEE